MGRLAAVPKAEPQADPKTNLLVSEPQLKSNPKSEPNPNRSTRSHS